MRAMSKSRQRRWDLRHLCIGIAARCHTSATAQSTAAAQQEAAESASAYWKGGRVKANEEPFRPVPIFGDGGILDYQAEDGVKECMDFYFEKTYEENLRCRLTQKELDAASPASRHVEDSAVQRPRGIIAYLMMENAARSIHKDLLLSLHCLARFFRHYPVVIFFTGGSTDAEIQKLSDEAPADLDLLFEEVHLDFPPELRNFPGGPDAFLAPPRCVMDGRHWWQSNKSCGCRCPAWRAQCWPLHWMHATRFFTAGMFRTRTFRSGEYDYFMRLDSDLFFVEVPIVDPFRLMATRGCAMVYDRLSRESPGCYDGFDERTIDFINNHFWYWPNGTPDTDILHVGHGPAAAGGQWTLGDARLFGSDAYLRFADYFASGIYANRWADQLFLVRGVSLFGPRSGAPAVPRDSIPQASICIRSLFDDGLYAQHRRKDNMIDAFGFVHTKGGYLDQELVSTCHAESVQFG